MHKTHKNPLTLRTQTIRELTQDESKMLAGGGLTSGSYHCGSAVLSGYTVCRPRTYFEPSYRCR